MILFKFKLEALLQVRCIEEEKCQKKLADSQIVVEYELSKLENLLEMQRSADRRFSDLQKGLLAGQESVMHLDYLKKIAMNIFYQNTKVAEAKSACDKDRKKLEQVTKIRKTIEKLKEKEQLKFIEKINSEEQKFINEMAINRFYQIQE